MKGQSLARIPLPLPNLKSIGMCRNQNDIRLDITKPRTCLSWGLFTCSIDL